MLGQMAALGASPAANPDQKRHAQFASPKVHDLTSAVSSGGGSDGQDSDSEAERFAEDNSEALKFALDDLVRGRNGAANSGESSSSDDVDGYDNDAMNTSRMSDVSVYLSLSEDSEDDEDDEPAQLQPGEQEAAAMVVTDDSAAAVGGSGAAAAGGSAPSVTASPGAAKMTLTVDTDGPPASPSQRMATPGGAVQQPAVPPASPFAAQEAAVEEDNDDACCDVFDEYTPEWVRKCRLETVKHPDKLVETTSLASTKYTEAIDYDIRPTVYSAMTPGSLSDAQLETTMVAGEKNDPRSPYVSSRDAATRPVLATHATTAGVFRRGPAPDAAAQRLPGRVLPRRRGRSRQGPADRLGHHGLLAP